MFLCDLSAVFSGPSSRFCRWTIAAVFPVPGIHVGRQFFAQHCADNCQIGASFQDHRRGRPLPAGGIGQAGHGAAKHSRTLFDDGFDFRRLHPVAGAFQHSVQSAVIAVFTVLVAGDPVAGRVPGIGGAWVLQAALLPVAGKLFAPFASSSPVSACIFNSAPQAGWPMGMGASARSRLLSTGHQQQTVVSVGPYRLWSRTWGSCPASVIRCAVGKTSPANRMLRRSGSGVVVSAPFRAIKLSSDGTVTRC